MTLALPEQGQVGHQSERGQRRELRLGSTRDLAWWIEVFHADEPLPTVMAREQPAAERGHEREISARLAKLRAITRGEPAGDKPGE